MDGSKFEAEAPAPLMNLKQVARVMNVSERTVWANSAPRGTIPVVPIGRSIRYCPREIQEWMKRQMQQTHSKTLSA
ncbi:MAG TPA: helix-turn-helix domain-containing protein [Schlesneria sp.]|jgi:predicted DNA-binding transcriptional regulator AlpA